MDEQNKLALNSPFSWHVFSVYSDPDFELDVMKLNEPPEDEVNSDFKWQTPYKELADKYFIHYMDVYRFKILGKEKSIKNRSGTKVRASANYDIKTDLITLSMNKYTTKNEFEEMWVKVRLVQTQRLKLEPTKRKPPHYPDLIYAVFKSLQNGEDFPKIYFDYENRKLKNYTKKPINSIYSPEKLKEYYIKYGPKQIET